MYELDSFARFFIESKSILKNSFIIDKLNRFFRINIVIIVGIHKNRCCIIIDNCIYRCNECNSGNDDFAFVIKESEEMGYFASNRRGTDNLYQFTREENEIVEAPTEVDPTSGQDLIPIDGSKIYFDFDKATIKKESEVVLDSVVTYMNDYPNIKVKVESHADARGSDSYNMALSKRRAASTVDYLVKKGIDRSRLTSEGYGEERPIATNNTAAGRQDNRRVEISLDKNKEVKDSDSSME